MIPKPYIISDMEELFAKFQNLSVVLREFKNTPGAENKSDIAHLKQRLEQRRSDEELLEEASAQLVVTARKSLDALAAQHNELAKSLAMSVITKEINGWELTREEVYVNILNDLQVFLGEIEETSKKRMAFQIELENVKDFSPKLQEYKTRVAALIAEYKPVHDKAKNVVGKNAEDQIQSLQKILSSDNKAVHEAIGGITFYNPKTKEEIDAKLKGTLVIIHGEQTALLKELQEKWTKVQTSMDILGEKITRLDVWIKKGGGIKPIETIKNWWIIGWGPSVTPFATQEEAKPKEEKKVEKAKKV